MPLEVPNLDDRSYADLVAEALAMLPHHAPEWTNHNASDPGITLVELLAYFTDLLIYRLNRVTRESKIRFLQLLRHVEQEERNHLADPSTPPGEVDEALNRAVGDLKRRQRAVTGEDYEWLARELTAGSPPGRRVVRAACFEGVNLDLPEDDSSSGRSPGHISLVVMPDAGPEGDETSDLVDTVREGLEPMRLLTTQLHVVKPRYLRVSVGALMRLVPGAELEPVRAAAVQGLKDSFDPLPGGGPDGEGWPFGRSLYLSEVYNCLERVGGVDSVEDVRVLRLSAADQALDDDRAAVGVQIGLRSTVGVDTRIGGDPSAGPGRLIRDPWGRLMAVSLRPHELLLVDLRTDDFMEMTP